MFDLLFYSDISSTGHNYSFAATGIKVKSKTFTSRDAANRHMYKIMNKYGLKHIETWNDNHDKTYICNEGVKFYIHRV